jgi:hypothetical protein
MKKIYLVYTEVIAKNITDAAKQKGKIYSIMLANDEAQLQLENKKPLGFKKK